MILECLENILNICMKFPQTFLENHTYVQYILGYKIF